MGKLTEFMQYHLATPAGQLMALQILVQEQLGLTPTVPPCNVNRYLTRLIHVKGGEPYVKDEDFNNVFNWDREGNHGEHWGLWIMHRLETLSQLVVDTARKDVRMLIYAFEYPIYAYNKLSEVGVRIPIHGKKKDIWVNPQMSYVRSHGELLGVFKPVDNGNIIFDNAIVKNAYKEYSDERKVVI